MKQGGLARVIPSILFQFLKAVSFEEEYLDALKILETYVVELSSNQIAMHNLKLVLNRFFSFELCMTDHEDYLRGHIKSFVFTSILELLSMKFYSRSSHVSTHFGSLGHSDKNISEPFKRFTSTMVSSTNKS